MTLYVPRQSTLQPSISHSLKNVSNHCVVLGGEALGLTSTLSGQAAWKIFDQKTIFSQLVATKVNNLLRPQMKLLIKYCFKLLRKFDFHNYLRKQTLQSSVIIATLHLILPTCSSIQAQAAVTGSMLAWSLWLGSLKPRTVVAEEGREGNC